MDIVEISGNFKMGFSMPENVMEISSKYFINYYFVNKISLLCKVKLACMP